MTVGCARCHDHKLDAISQTDYYALGGHIYDAALGRPAQSDSPNKHAKQIGELKRSRDDIRRQTWVKLGRRIAVHSHRPRRCEDGAIEHPAEFGIREAWATLHGPLRQLSSRRRLVADRGADRQLRCGFHSIDRPGGWFRIGQRSCAGEGYLHGHIQYAAGAPFRDSTRSAVPTRAWGPAVRDEQPHGNFVLSEISVSVTPASQSKQKEGIAGGATRISDRRLFPAELPLFRRALKKAPGPGWGVGLGGNIDRTAKSLFLRTVRFATRRTLGPCDWISSSARNTFLVDFVCQWEEPHQPMNRLRTVTTKIAQVKETWTKLAKQFREERSSRLKGQHAVHVTNRFFQGRTSRWLDNGWGRNATRLRPFGNTANQPEGRSAH